MIRRLLFGILALPSLWAGNGHATSIVALRSPDSVVIAADSLLTIRNTAGADIRKSECKIFQSGDLFYSFSGFYKDPARAFDVSSLVSEILRQGGSFDAVSERAAQGVVDAMKGDLQRIKGEYPALYEKYFGNATGPLLQLLFATYRDGVPRIAVYDIMEAAGSSAEIVLRYGRRSCPGDCRTQDTTAYFMTDMRPIENFLKHNKLVSRSPEDTAKFLVELVINAHTPFTGPPVDVLRIDRSGAAWVEHKPQCPDIAPLGH